MMHWFSMNRSQRPRLRHRERSSSSVSDSTLSRRHLLRRKRRAKSKEQREDAVAPQSAAWRIHNILKAPPKESEWWEEATPSTDDIEESDSQSSSDQQPSRSLSSDDSKRFQNRGYDAWEKARKAWRTPTTTKPRKKPPPVKRDTVIRGVMNGKRTYELPGRMTLSDMVGLYQQVWSEQD